MIVERLALLAFKRLNCDSVVLTLSLSKLKKDCVQGDLYYKVIFLEKTLQYNH